MKKLLLITGLFLLSVLQLNGQDWKSKQDSIRYAVAYEYIVNDPLMKDKEIILSDRIMSTNFFYFSRTLEPYIRVDNENNEDYLTKLYKVDKYSIEQDTVTTFKYPINVNDGAVRELSFSKIIDGFLFASVSFTNREHPFGFWFEYCFIFDLDNTIKKVFREEAHGL